MLPLLLLAHPYGNLHLSRRLWLAYLETIIRPLLLMLRREHNCVLFHLEALNLLREPPVLRPQVDKSLVHLLFLFIDRFIILLGCLEVVLQHFLPLYCASDA